jgi:hypothetical protein
MAKIYVDFGRQHKATMSGQAFSLTRRRSTVNYASNLLTCTRRSRYWAGREPAPIVAWRYRQVVLERGAHPFFIAKTAAAGDAVDALLGFFQQAPGSFQPEQFDCFGRSAAGLCLVASSEVSRTHAHLCVPKTQPSYTRT